jgi:hypothetical protein
VFIGAVTRAMQRAKGQGKNVSCAAEASDFERSAEVCTPIMAATS